MPIAKEILNMFEFSRNQENTLSISMNPFYRNKYVYPQGDEPFRSIDTYNRKASVALWVHPFTLP